MKKFLKILTVFILGLCIGCGAMLALDYVQGGGSVEEFKGYVKETVIPSAISAMATLIMMYVGSRSRLNKVDIASDGLLKATSVIDSVSESGAKTSAAATDMVENMRHQAEREAAMQEQITLAMAKLEKMQSMIAMGFGNLPELVKSGNARKIYELMEEDKDETES